MDIIERLRQLEVNELSTHPLGMLDEAANEIEQNRIDLEEYRLDVERLTGERDRQYDYNVEQIAKQAALEAENEKLSRDYQSARDAHDKVLAENEKLRAALEKLIRACYEGRIVQRGVGGMTIEAQTRNSVINGVWAWSVCEAEEVLNSAALSGDKQ
jgi:hypothetical protein